MNCEGCIYLGKVFDYLKGYQETNEWRECKYELPYFATTTAVSIEHDHNCRVKKLEE